MQASEKNVRLAYSSWDHSAFCGACSWADGSKPLFAEVRFRVEVRGDRFGAQSYGTAGTLVLDPGGDPDLADVPTATCNLQADDGSAAAFVRTFPGWTRAQAKRWLEEHVRVEMDLGMDLGALGFRFEEF